MEEVVFIPLRLPPLKVGEIHAPAFTESSREPSVIAPCQLIGRPAGCCWITRPTEPAGRETSCAFSPETTKQEPFPTCKYVAS